MSIKTKIKNDLWRWNYILPFVKKHQFDEKGKMNMVKYVLQSYEDIRPIKSREKTVGNDTKKLLSSSKIEFDNSSQFVYFIDTHKTITVQGNILSNFTLDYDRIIHGDFETIALSAIGDDQYGKEAHAVIDGVRLLCKRITDEINVAGYPIEIALRRQNDFKEMLTRPAKHFDEGLQRILFFNQVLWQTRHRLNGLGRLDKILGDLYENDIKEGYTDYIKAADTVYDFYLQLSKYSSYKSDALEGDIGQIVILGGLGLDGNYFSNDLTKIFLEQQARLKKPDPKTVLRVSKKMPTELLEVSVECLKSKTGSPLFSNDDVVIPALLDFGMPAVDAYSYCTSACWEPYIVGNSMDQNNIAVFDFFSAFDIVLDEDYHSFEELLQAYISKNKEMFEIFLDKINEMKWAKDPLVSIFTDDCNKKRMDISKGAAVYNNYGITTVALSNVIDSLINIKKIVYDNNRYTLKELNSMRDNNFEHHIDLYEEFKCAKKSYGHDDAFVIDIVNRITGTIVEIAEKYRNQFGGTVKFGLSSPGYNILSKKTKADFAGRKAGMPYNTHISCADAPYTEVVNFASHINYNKQRFNGNVIDFFASPNFLEEQAAKFGIFLKMAIGRGFFQMQMNIMDSKTLIEAKKNPEKYKGLIVRVWGFSAYFHDLPESYKELLIERAIAAEKSL